MNGTKSSGKNSFATRLSPSISLKALTKSLNCLLEETCAKKNS